MGLYFKSLCSSSGGNSLVLWTETTCIVVDCGFGSMKRCRAALGPYLSEPDRDRAVLLSHAHTDHVSHYPLRVLEQLAVPVYVHATGRDLLTERHFNGRGFSNLDLRTFEHEPFIVGDFTIQPIELEHHPWFPTFGFAFQCQVGRRRYRVVTLTDFCRWDTLVDRLRDADFVFVESNHDLELLELYYNPNSRFHSPNPDTGRLLCQARQCSRRPFGGVMLGHISPQRNRASLALEATQAAFMENGLAVDFPLYAAPLREPSETIVIAP